MIKEGFLIELNTNDPVDKAIQDLIDLGLVEAAYDTETGELGVTPTVKSNELLATMEYDETDEYIDGDEFQGFLNKAKKILDSIEQDVLV